MTKDRKIGIIYNKNSFKISLIKGGKGDTDEKILNDRIVMIETSKPHGITMEELAIIAREISISEDNLFPRADGYKGRNKTLQLLRAAIQKWHWSIADCCYDCKIPGFTNEFGLCIDRKQRPLFE